MKKVRMLVEAGKMEMAIAETEKLRGREQAEAQSFIEAFTNY